MIKKLHNNQQGMILVSVFIIVGVLLVIGISLASFTMSQYTIANKKVYSANAVMAAEAGIEQTMQELNQNDNFAGYSTSQVFFNNTVQGRGVFTTVIESAGNSETRIITSTGTVYKYNQSTNPISRRKVKVTVVGTTSEGYSVHTGPGGLLLGGSANITNSDVFVNGTIDMSGVAQIGTQSQPLQIKVAHLACPTGNNPGPTYPSLCTSGEPISLQQSTRIYGSVCATNQTSTGPNNNILGGSGGQGLIVGCKAPPASPPTYDRAGHIAKMTTTGSGDSDAYVCNSSGSLTRNWPANLRLKGNVTITGSCDVTLNGNVYIEGSLTINGAASVRVSNSVNTVRPVIIADGDITLAGSAQLIANTSGIGAHFISFRSTASCNPNCTTVTGTDLKNSQNLQTVSVGGSTNLPGMIFQAYWSKVTISGSGNIGAAAGQTVDMQGAGTVTFGTALSSGVRSWTITSYQQKFD